MNTRYALSYVVKIALGVTWQQIRLATFSKCFVPPDDVLWLFVVIVGRNTL